MAAHVAGFSAGALFHLGVTRPLKARYFAFGWYEFARRAVLVPASLGLYAGLHYLLERQAAQKARPQAVQVTASLYSPT